MSARTRKKNLGKGDNHPEQSKVFIGAYIPETHHAKLKEIAKDNHRSMAGQIAFEIERIFANG